MASSHSRASWRFRTVDQAAKWKIWAMSQCGFQSGSFALPLVHFWVNSECSFVIYYIYMYMLCYCNYISHLHFKQKIKVTTSFIWLRIRMDTIPLSLQWVASLRQIVLAITSGALNEIHGAGTVVWFVLWKAPGWEQVNYACTSSYIYIYVCIHVYVYMYICMYIYTHVYTRR